MHRMPCSLVSGRPLHEWFALLVLTLLLATPASADVQIREKTVSEGLAGFGNGTTNRMLTVAGDKSRSEDEYAYTGRFKTLAGGGKPHTRVAIVRLDKEVMWNVDPEKKEYTELTFDEFRRAMEAGAAEAEKEKAEAPAEAKDVDMTFSVDVQRTGAKQDVNGFPAEQVIVTCVGKAKSKEKGEETGELRMIMDEWLTKNAPGTGELRAYEKSFAEKIGLDAEMSGMNSAARRMYGNGMRELSEKLRGLEGFPVRSTFTIEGPPAEQGQQGGAASDQKKSGEETKKAQAAEDKREDAEDAAQASQGKGLTGKLGGFLGRKAARSLEKKSEKKAEEAASSGSSAPSGGPLFKVVTDVVSITTTSAPAGSFEVPAGYKLQQKKD